MGTYIVGDIHGCYSEWIQLKDKIEQQDSNATFILVGDIIDRGKETYQMVMWAMDNITTDGKYQMVIGNHEREKIEGIAESMKFIKYHSDLPLTSINVVKDYNDRFDLFGQLDVGTHSEAETCDLLFNFVKWTISLPYIKDIVVNNQRFIIAHANIPYSIIEDNYSIKKELNAKDKDYILWNRETYGFDKIPNAILVHGHTHTLSIEAFYGTGMNSREVSKHFGKIVHTPNRYNLDCGIVFRGCDKNANLAALRIDDLKEFYLYE